jgi:uncharacterized membrane protein YbhN (UPF0104 family)
VNRRQILGTVAAILLTAAFVWWLAGSRLLEPVLVTLRQAALPYLLLILPLVVILQLARAARFVLLLDRMRAGGLLATFQISCVHIALNFLLPFKLGEAAFPLLARRLMGVGLASGTSTLLTVRLLDLGALGTLLAFSAALAVPDLAPYRWLLVAGSVLSLLAPLALLILAGHGQRQWGRLAAVGEVLARARSHGTFGKITLLSVLVWACHAGAAYLSFLAVNQSVQLAAAAFAGASGNLAFALPFQGIAGVGPVQAAFAWAAVLCGVALEPAVAAAIACHASLLVSGCLLAFIAIALEPRLRVWQRRVVADPPAP